MNIINKYIFFQTFNKRHDRCPSYQENTNVTMGEEFFKSLVTIY